jgi:hypothetical protein
MVWLRDIPFSTYRRGFYWALPHFRPYDVSARDLRPLIWRGALGAIALTTQPTKQYTQYILRRGPEYEFPDVNPKKRTQARQGLRRCEIRRVAWDDMARDGLAINREALQRQTRSGSYLGDEQWWERQCRISSGFPDVQAWGAYFENQLASYVHVIIHDWNGPDGTPQRAADLVHFMSSNTHLKHHPNEALIYWMTREMIASQGCNFVLLGTTSDDPYLLDWKLRMGYTTERTGYAIAVNPALHAAKHFLPKLRMWIDGNETRTEEVLT